MSRPDRRVAGQLEFHLLVLVTLGLVAFGLVMVYSASSGRAAVATGDPAYYLKRQALYAVDRPRRAGRALASPVPPAALRSAGRSWSRASGCSSRCS